jgi:transcriptional antiterminator NusG
MAKKNKNEELENLEDDFDLEDESLFEEEYEEEFDETESLADKALETETLSETESNESEIADSDSLTEDTSLVSDVQIKSEADETLKEVDPSKAAKWYVVHTYSGHENKVKINIEKIVENRGMQDLILSIVVPTEDRVEIKDGQRKIKTRKMFPGYVIVKMLITNESWYLVRNTQGVTGFVGHGSEPVPLTNEEVRRMGIEKVYIKLDLEIGDSVKVINGPFESFMGTVEEIHMDKQILKVKISMFGRETPVELEFGQVDKL